MGPTSASSPAPVAGDSEVFSYPSLERFGGGRPAALLALIGPGVLVASVSVGTGETLFAPRVGAIFGYSLFWVIAWTVVLKGLQVYAGARYLVLTGEHPVAAWARLPGPRAWLPLLLTVIILISLPMWTAAIAGSLGNLLAWVTGRPGEAQTSLLWSCGFLLIALILTQLQSYEWIERISWGILALKIALLFAAAAIIRPDWAAALWGTLVPAWPGYSEAALRAEPGLAARPLTLEVATLAGAIGAGVQDYIGYLGLMRHKKWGALGGVSGIEPSPSRLPLDPAQIQRGRKWLRVPLLDTSLSFFAVFLLSASTMLLGAALLHPQALIPQEADLFGSQSRFLTILHPALLPLYQLGIFVALFGVIYGVFEVWSQGVFELLRAVVPRLKENRRPAVRTAVIWYAGLGGLVVLATGWRTIGLVSIVGPLTGIVGCGLWCLAMVWVERRFLPPPYRAPLWFRSLTLLTGLLLLGFGLWALGV